ncbi:hypothetical protein H4J59_07745 [Colwellia sp. MB02u-10]|uniref:hypothetical protein n=1 Tax=Colwellia sp. MB02u-10 TaxID=2759828 RepID=UPI0015F4F02B|nr:hypothetical protein [Colwellia sp. MB02u-10]MBA6340881.1 hypothetical protein [Colwellia sp. MB02u-10]
MVTQSLLWQSQQQSSDFAELCNALYERELITLARNECLALASLQGRIKSLPHYVKRTAFALLKAQTPLELDIQNASWLAKQVARSPEISQLSAYDETVIAWYKSQQLVHGLVVPIALNGHVFLDCIDRIDLEKQRFRTNVYGWFYLTDNETVSAATNRVKNEGDRASEADIEAESKAESEVTRQKVNLLKPTKKVMSAACAGHRWKDGQKLQPIMPSLRELLLSCTINWRNFKQPRVN